MTYLGVWKNFLILSHCLNTSRMLFLVTTDVSLWDINPAVEHSFWKVQVTCQVIEFCCAESTGWSSSSGLYASSPATRVMSLFGIGYIPCYHLVQEQEGLGHWKIGPMAEGTSTYWTWCLFLRFIPFRFIMLK